WEVHYSSQSPTGINLPVQAGLAMTVKTPRSVPEGCRIVGEAEGLPPLGQVEIELHRRPGHTSEALEAFCEELEHLVIDHDDVAAPEPSDVAT
ncbi:MAG: LysR family transcriptional regulator, partial [Halomonas sp.]|nr:LysR family transcriptional regulator [Halomonas sp.]